MRSWMVTGVPDELQPALDAATESASYEEMAEAIAAHFVPLSKITYTQAVSFISIALDTEGETSDDGETVWQRDDASLTLSPYALLPEGEWPNRVIYALLGYCYSQDIPFLGFGNWGNLIPEYAFKAKSAEKEARISTIYARAEANMDDPEILMDCFEELAALDAPPPPSDSPLGKALAKVMGA